MNRWRCAICRSCCLRVAASVSRRFSRCSWKDAVAAVVVDEALDPKFADSRDHPIEERPVVRHQDHGAGVVAEVVLQPDDGLEIEMVGRLIEQQHGRPLEQELRQRYSHLPAAAELVGQPAVVAVDEPEAGQNLRGPGVDREPVPGLELVLQGRVLPHDTVVHRPLVGQRRHLVLELPHAVLDAREVREHGQDLVEESPAGQRQTLLRKIPVGRPL